MAVYREEPVVRQEVVQEPATGNGGLTSFALVKYGFILAITIVILYFLARFVLPMING